MNEQEAADAMERALLGGEERVLTDLQALAMELASQDVEEAKERAQTLRNQANQVEAQGRRAMRQVVLAIRKELGVPDGTQLVFARDTEDSPIVGRWTPPPPPSPQLSLVPEDEGQDDDPDTGDDAIE